MKSSIILISNPAAKGFSQRKIEHACRFLGSKGCKVERVFTNRKGEATDLARDAAAKAPSLIIAAGGDGTINEVVNGVAGSEVPVAILPLGTTNVLAKELDIPEDVTDAMAVAIERTPQIISLGKIELIRPSSFIPRYFVLMAGIGYDGEAVFGINESLKKISGKGAYVFSGIKTLFNFDPEELLFTINGKTYTGYSAIIGNAAKYGGQFKVTPHAKLTEPYLDVCIFKGRRSSDILRYVFGIATNSHLSFRDVEYIKTKSIEINGTAHIQIDGDYFGMTPAKIHVAPDALRLVF